MAQEQSQNQLPEYQEQWTVVDRRDEQPFEFLQSVAEDAIKLFDDCELSQDDRDQGYLIALTYLNKLIDAQEMEERLADYIPESIDRILDFYNLLQPAFYAVSWPDYSVEEEA